MEKKKSEIKLVEEYLSQTYIFRYNEIKCVPEYIDGNRWLALNDYKLNSLLREIDSWGVHTTTGTIKSILTSDFVKKINPVKHYFENLKPYTSLEKDYIKQLSLTVNTKTNEVWHEYFKRWLVAVVANVFTDNKCCNHTCLVLCGEQGAFKSTWLNNLCPKELMLYLYIGRIDPDKKDSISKIADYLFINIDDQLRELNKVDENKLKSLITQDDVKFRRAYDKLDSYYPHLASFMGSVNGIDFLTDSTGSRRFLPFEIVSIDINAAIKLDMDLVYSQAYYLFKSGYQYWFTQDEIQQLHQHNENFRVISVEEQLVLDHFLRPANRSEATHFWQIATIEQTLFERSKIKISRKKLGEALKRNGYERFQKTVDGSVKYVYSLIVRDLSDVIKGGEANRIEAQNFSSLNIAAEDKSYWTGYN